MTIFQRIINKEIPSNIVFEDERVIAFYDIQPQKPGHFLVVPKSFSRNLIDISDEDLKYLILISRKLALIEIAKLGVKGFNLIVNNEPEAGQEVFHTHVHIIPSLR